jgi:thermitase
MRREISLLIALSLTVLLGITVAAGQLLSGPNPGGLQAGSNETAFVPGQIVVKTKDSAPADAIASINRRSGARLEEKVPGSRASLIDLPEGLSVAEAVEFYEASPEVAYAEPNYRVAPAAIMSATSDGEESALAPDDPMFADMYSLYNKGQSGGTFDADIDGLEAWSDEAWSATTGNSETVVAVIDTGMDINHPDLKNNVWTNPGETGVDKFGNDMATNGEDDDKNGYIDDVHGWDFFHDDNTVYDDAAQDRHGTVVGGIIAAEGDNGLGVTGVSWKAQTKLMPLKFIGPNDASNSWDAAEALEYAVRNGVKISNNSWAYDYTSEHLERAVAEAEREGHLIVAAAMNGGLDFVGDNNDDIPMYPASYGNDNIISVAASNNRDELASFSNYGPTSVDLAAPGKDVVSTDSGNRYGDNFWGTSMATPYVTGVAALVKSQSPQLDAKQIRDLILGSVDEKPGLENKLATGGRLNAAKALQMNTAPVVLDVRPRRSGIRAIISATVRDDETDLTESQIELYLDGHQRNFSYDPATDKLTYRTGKLRHRRHNVRIVVRDYDEQVLGQEGLEETRFWSFKGGRRR